MQEPPIRDDGLQLEEHRVFQRVFWTTERAAWIVAGVLLILALLGLSGADGYFATARTAVGSGEIEYPRIGRWEASDTLKVNFGQEGETHRLSLDPAFFDYFQVEDVHPEPERALSTPQGTTMEFTAEGGAAVEATLYLRALRPGWPSYSVDLDGAGGNLSTVILP